MQWIDVLEREVRTRKFAIFVKAHEISMLKAADEQGLRDLGV
jgi:hypothetical protein